MKLILFDIDGTLLVTGGAGKSSLETAFQHCHRHNMDGVPMAGRTDRQIYREAMMLHGLDWSMEQETAFRDTYLALLTDALRRPHPQRRLCPGVQTLLAVLHQRDDCQLALLTGNWEASARMKLRHFNIDHYFPFGAFTDDSPHRPDLVLAARHKFQAMTGRATDNSDIFVIGDTPMDIQAARAHGVVAVAVASGFASAASLKAEAPEHFFQDLRDTAAVLSALGLAQSNFT